MKKKPAERTKNKVENFEKALRALDKSATTPVTEPRDLSGIIKDFEITYELSWKAMKQFLELEGHEVKSAKHAFSLGYQLGFIKDEGVWLEMIDDRNDAVHTYNEALAREICERVRIKYISKFRDLLNTLQKSG